jgi:hypothetical protein
MTRTSVLVSTLLAVSLLPAASLAQSRTDAIPGSGGRAASVAGPGFDGPLNRPGWNPDGDGGLHRPDGLPPGVAQAIENQCDGEQWYIVSQDPETNRIVFRCEPPPRE